MSHSCTVATLYVTLTVVGCGGSQRKRDPDPDPDVREFSTRSPRPIGTPATPGPQSAAQKRQLAACEQVGKRMTACSIADAQATMTPQQLKELDLATTGPKHTAAFVEECMGSELSERQLRVLEVCDREEKECEPLLSCLDNLRAPATSKP